MSDEIKLPELDEYPNPHGYPACDCFIMVDPECVLQPPYKTYAEVLEMNLAQRERQLLEELTKIAELERKNKVYKDGFLAQYDAYEELKKRQKNYDEDDWCRLTGDIIDTVHMINEDYVHDELKEKLKRYFDTTGEILDESKRDF
jgi:hypothetical protein